MLLLSLFSAWSAAEAADNPVLEPVLLPVYSAPAPGAYGSIWQTEFAVMNAGNSSAVYSFPIAESFPSAGVSRFAAGHALRMGPLGYQQEGVFFWVDRDHIDDFVFSLRVRDQSRNALSAGTAIPVVRDHSFRRRIVLLDVPTDRRFRLSLRVYGREATRPQVLVRVYPFEGRRHVPTPTQPVAEMLLPLTSSQGIGPPGWTIPAQAAVHDMTSVLPAAASFPAVRIEIEALDPAERIWAFVAITNNVTQELTLVTAD